MQINDYEARHHGGCPPARQWQQVSEQGEVADQELDRDDEPRWQDDGGESG